MSTYDKTGHLIAELNPVNEEHYSLADGSLSIRPGNIVSYAGYGPAINDTGTNQTMRRVIYVQNGDKPMCDKVNGARINGVYPISIPDDCDTVNLKITPSSQWMYATTRSYINGIYSAGAIDNSGWVQGEFTLNITRVKNERMFLFIALRYDSSSSPFPSNPTDFTIDFVRGDIVDLNPDAKEKLLQAKRPKNGGQDVYKTNTQPCTLFWFSDIHSDQLELKRLIKLRNKYADLLDDTICTGDMAKLRFSDGMDWWYNTPDSDNILMVIGNHDALAGSTGYDWTNLESESTQYERYFAPNISKWGCVYTTNKTYYYKDYADKKVRIIVLNVMLTGDDKTAQETWLTSTLESARSAGLSVVIANHGPIEKADKIDCNFNSYDAGGSGTSTSSYIALSESYMAIVQGFIDAGGEFICHIAGHSHVDRFLRSRTYPAQRCIVIDASSVYYCNQYSDTQRTLGTKAQDLANFIVFDTNSKVVKIIRIGADMDHYCRQKHGMTFNYLTGEILIEY